LSAPSIVVLVVDRLGAGWLGPYGNSWVDTPAFNRLASQSLLFDCAMVASPCLEATYDAYWYGRHPLQGPVDTKAAKTLMEYARSLDFKTTLITDSPQVEELYAAGDFDETLTVADDAPRELAEDLAATRLAQTMALAIDSIQSQTTASVTWVHAGGLNDAWDMPAAIMQRLVDEEDPVPPSMLSPPNQRLTEAFDPDLLLGMTQNYAGQVMGCDLLLDVLLEVVESRPDTVFLCTSTRGYPLGEHLRVGECDNALFGELLHVPMMIRMPDLADAARRSRCFVQPHDVFTTLLGALGVSVSERTAGVRDLRRVGAEDEATRVQMCAAAGDQYAIRTPAWYLRVSEDEGHMLYAKPDDFWEANEVASRCGEVVQMLEQAYAEWVAAANAGHGEHRADLPDVLLHGLD